MEHTPRGPLIPASIIHDKRVNNIWDGLLMLAALLVVALRWEVAGALVFLGAIAFMLVVSDRLSDCWVPLILMTVFLTRCYNSYDIFIKYVPYYAVAFAAIPFQII